MTTGAIAETGTRARSTITGLSPRTQSRCADALGSGLAVLAALLIWATTFDSLRYLAVVNTGIVLGCASGALAALLRRVWLAIPIALVGYLLIAPPLVLASTGSGMPSPENLRRAALIPVTGWKELLTTLPPVEADGPLAGLPLFLAVVASAATFAIAMASGSALAPSVIPAAVVVLVLLLGTDDPSHAPWFALACCGVLIAWAAFRRRRGTRVVGTGGGLRSQLAIGAGLLVLAGVGGSLLAGVLAPTPPTERFVLRSLVEPPFDINQYPSPLATFRRFGEDPRELRKSSLFRVAGLQTGERIRVAVLDSYSGTVWGAGSNTASSRFRKVGRTILPDPLVAGQPERTVTLTIEPTYAAVAELNVWVPGIGPTSRLAVSGPGTDSGADSLRYDPGTAQAVLPSRLQAGDRIAITGSAVRTVPATGIEPASGSGTDPAVTAFVAGAASEHAGSARTPWERLLAVGIYLRENGAFSDGTQTASGATPSLPGHGEGRLASFLAAGEPTGSDEQFAAAFALIANQLGIPARVVLGAAVPDGGVVTGADMHAWVEVQATNGEWFAFPNDKFMPSRSKKTSEPQKHNVTPLDTPQLPASTPRQAPGALDVLGTSDPGGSVVPKSAPPANALASGLTVPTWVAPVATWGGPPVLALAAVVLLIGSVRGLRRRRRRTRGTPSRRLAAGWRDLVDHARDLGHRVDPTCTRTEQASAIGFRDLAMGADRAVFAANEPTAAEIADYWGAVRQARKQLSRGVSARRRLLRPWVPHSLWARDGTSSNSRTFRRAVTRPG